MTMHPRLFRKVMGTFATGVTVLSTLDSAGLPYGVTVNSFTAVSLEPTLILVCLDNRLSGLQHFLDSRRFVVNILGEDQEEVSSFFAAKGSDRSRFDEFTESGLPVLGGVISRLECDLASSHPAGDHTVLLARVTAVSLSEDADERGPLLFYKGRYGRIADSRSDPEPTVLGSRAPKV